MVGNANSTMANSLKSSAAAIAAKGKNDDDLILYEEFKDFVVTPLSESLSYHELKHAAHCMIYAKWNRTILMSYKPRMAILMELRDDGRFGFPGGSVDPDENLIDALNRELAEEIGLNVEKHCVNEKNHIISQVNHDLKFVTHFFALEISLNEFEAIEKNCFHARDYGTEVIGIFRACLYTMQDGYRGFPAFLKNNFIGNSKQHLCEGLRRLNIMHKDEIKTALNKECNQT